MPRNDSRRMLRVPRRLPPKPDWPDGPNDVAGYEGGRYPYNASMTYYGLHHICAISMGNRLHGEQYQLSLDPHYKRMLDE